jgi:hypothetical protein
MCEELVIASRPGQRSQSEEVDARRDGLPITQGVLDLRFIFSRQSCCVLTEEFEYVATDKVVTGLVRDA